jgi:hypothetical protein
VRLTVHGDGDALGQDEAISALERGDLAELVQLQVLGRHALGRLGLDRFDVEVVLLRDGEQSRGARVALQQTDVSLRISSCGHEVALTE